jgi:hypothetical protein
MGTTTTTTTTTTMSIMYHVYTPQQPAPQPQPKSIDTVWLVYHQKEPYYHSAWSYDSHLRYGSSSIDKICVGRQLMRLPSCVGKNRFASLNRIKKTTLDHSEVTFTIAWTRAVPIPSHSVCLQNNSPAIHLGPPKGITTRSFSNVVGACRYIHYKNQRNY